MGVPVLIVTGPVGVGKTTVAHEVGRLLRPSGVPYAVVDIDALAGSYPPPPGDGYNIVTVKHPVMKDRLGDVVEVLAAPDEIRRSVQDESLVLFYRRAERRWTCAVAKRLNGEGFLITCYPTDRIKSGDVLWRR